LGAETIPQLQFPIRCSPLLLLFILLLLSVESKQEQKQEQEQEADLDSCLFSEKNSLFSFRYFTKTVSRTFARLDPEGFAR
jgi:hypothetical protein